MVQIFFLTFLRIHKGLHPLKDEWGTADRVLGHRETQTEYCLASASN